MIIIYEKPSAMEVFYLPHFRHHPLHKLEMFIEVQINDNRNGATMYRNDDGGSRILSMEMEI